MATQNDKVCMNQEKIFSQIEGVEYDHLLERKKEIEKEKIELALQITTLKRIRTEIEKNLSFEDSNLSAQKAKLDNLDKKGEDIDCQLKKIQNNIKFRVEADYETLERERLSQELEVTSKQYEEQFILVEHAKLRCEAQERLKNENESDTESLMSKVKTLCAEEASIKTDLSFHDLYRSRFDNYLGIDKPNWTDLH